MPLSSVSPAERSRSPSLSSSSLIMPLLPPINRILGLILVLAIISRSSSSASSFNLTVAHVNDIHVRLEETNTYSGVCKDADKDSNKCFGGVSRLVTAVRELRERDQNVIFLNGGDFYQGNVWYTFFKWRVVAHFGNILNFTAMSPGNHEFDDHVSGFVPFLKNATFPIVAANMDVSMEPTLTGEIPKSVIIEIGGRKIGIIGYVTSDTPDISNPDKVKFLPEVESIDAEAKRLKAVGVDILIALGHSGYEVDQAIAAGVPDIDLVVGGHSHSFLYSGAAPSVEKPSGPYPTLVRQPGTRRVVPVVQAYAYTKYLGVFKLQFDEDGEVVAWEGEPKLLDASTAQDQRVLNELVPWKREIDVFAKQTVASTNVVLRSKRGEENNLGNLVTDSMVDHFSQDHNSEESWTSVALAFINSGGLRGDFELGNITMYDVLTVLPFKNSIDVITIKGKYLLQTFEIVAGGKWATEADGSLTKAGSGRFLQVSGFRVVVDPGMEEGHRIRQLLVRCSACKVPRFLPIEMETEYKVATVGYLANGGDGLKILKEKATSRLPGPLDTDVFVAYIKRVTPITQGVENRYMVLRAGQHLQTTSGAAPSMLLGVPISTVLLPFLICSLINQTQK